MQGYRELEQKILDYLNEYRDSDKLYSSEGGLQTSDAIFCAQDRVRNRAFYQALQSVITPESVMVDAGSGTGILGFFALGLGAKKVILVENNPTSLELSRTLADYLGYRECIEFVLADAKEVALETEYDILVSETLTSGFSAEDFPAIVRNLAKTHPLIIPEKFIFHCESYDRDMQELEQRDIELRSADLPEFFPLKVPKETHSISISTSTYLTSEIILESGDCCSFMNTRSFEISQGHPFLRIEKGESELL